jgi:hypothetical protein
MRSLHYLALGCHAGLWRGLFLPRQVLGVGAVTKIEMLRRATECLLWAEWAKQPDAREMYLAAAITWESIAGQNVDLSAVPDDAIARKAREAQGGGEPR